MQSTDIQELKNSTGPTPNATKHAGVSAGVPQYIPQHKKPSFAEGQDLRLQAAESLIFIRDELAPDLSAEDIFYIDHVVDLLNRLVDADHIDRKGVAEVLAWDF